MIDLSGDAPSTVGEPVEAVRDHMVGQRIIINAPAIGRPNKRRAGLVLSLDFELRNFGSREIDK